MKYLFILCIIVFFVSCEPEDDENCIETICADGFSNCVDKPCDI